MLSFRRINLSLIVVSFLMLFAEVVLIRWLSTESRIFAYVNNLVLLSAFLGIGIGSYFAHRRTYPSVLAFSLSAILLMIQLPLNVSIGGESLHLFRDVPVLLSAFTDSVIWYEVTDEVVLWKTLLGMASVFAIFFAVLVAFIPLGQILGRELDDHQNTIAAYSLNVFASICGVWFLAVISFYYAPPWLWFALIVVLFVLLVWVQPNRRPTDYVSAIVLLGLTVGLLVIPRGDPDRLDVIWSPYQKLSVYDMVHEPTGIQRGYLLNVNEVGYMGLLDLSEEFVLANPRLLSMEERATSQYDIPYRFKPDAEDALILGAGAGNDAAGALRHDVQSVDAVEIDPGIYELGKKYHPEDPYSDPRVNVIIDDARAVLDRIDQTYDVVSVGLLDAHTLSSSYNNMRMDHYVYTLEAFAAMRDRLKPDGILTVAFEARRSWISLRLHDLLEKVFGHPPTVLKYPHGRYGFGGTVFVIGRDSTTVPAAIEADADLKRFAMMYRERLHTAGKPGERVKLTTDDWPYLYLESPRIPNMHLLIMAILILLVLLARRLIIRREGGLNWHFFFLGAAFLLLEFQNISKSILLLGSTWLVNSVIITGILLLVLLANFYVHRFKPTNLRPFYGILFVLLGLTYLTPLSWFNAMPFWPRVILGTGFLNLPIFFASVVFITSFKSVRSKNHAFGSNLLGSAVGGVLESLSFVVGVNALVLVALLLYIGSMVTIKRQ
ncbi:hypothetical protein GF356_06160 [candidate division GN15 bacterium]|nr:hypothetical protein [candidate division GN15 bacterium]